MKCYVHPEVDAVGTCTVCGKSVCSSCAVDYQGKVTCKSCVEKITSQQASAAAAATAASAVSGQAPPGRKEPILSLILSFFIPGLGQAYNGQIKKGIALFVGYAALWIVMMVIYFAGALVTMGVGALCCIPVFLIPLILWLYAMYDGYKVANMINSGMPTKDWLS